MAVSEATIIHQLQKCKINVNIQLPQAGKCCSKCLAFKLLDAYYKHKQTKDGENSSCKNCHNEIQNQYYDHNKEKVNKVQKQYYNKNKEKISVDKKQYYNNNRNKIRAYKKSYQARSNELRMSRTKTDENYRIAQTLRSRIKATIKSQNTTKSFIPKELIGCSKK